MEVNVNKKLLSGITIMLLLGREVSRRVGKCIIGRNLKVKVVKKLVVMGCDFLRKSMYSLILWGVG